MKHSLLILLTALLPLGGTAKAFEVNFSKDAVEDLFEGSAKALPQSSDGLVALPAQVETRPLPVEPKKKYKLEITAEVEGDFVTEANERAHILTLQSHRHRLAGTYEIAFQDAGGNDIPAFGGSYAGLQGFFLSNQRMPYTAVFYTPENAAALKVKFLANGSATRIASLQLTEEDKEETVNPNPDFRYGELNYSGWRPQRDGRLYTRADGKTVFNAGYGGGSPYFPLHPGSKYQLSAVGEGKTINIQYFNKDGKSLLSRFLFRPTAQGVATEITPPPEAAMARIIMYGEVILEEFKVTEVK